MKKSIKQHSFGLRQNRKSLTYRPERQSSIQSILNKRLTNGLLPRGNGLSYGDVCLNQTLIQSQRLNRFINYKAEDLSLQCEPGVDFKDLLNLPQAICPPVIPGTLHVSLGGAVANDIHGKNHLHLGSIGEHIKELELVLPNDTLIVSKENEPRLFKATIGGLGLTGFISKITLAMRRAPKFVEVSIIPFEHLNVGVAMLKHKGPLYEYSAIWVDFHHQTRGLLYLANPTMASQKKRLGAKLNIPLTLPFSLINPQAISLFNHWHFVKAKKQRKPFIQSLAAFNNPLDNIQHWNRLYGTKGLVQLQCVLPFEHFPLFIKDVNKVLDHFAIKPTMAVVKLLKQQGIGLLSFTKEGVTIALDFVKNSQSVKVIETLHEVLIDYQGKVYLAKDSLLKKQQFQKMYPQYSTFIDVLEEYKVRPYFQSKLSRRLGIHA